MAGSDVEWSFYDRDKVVLESRRNLPHVDMPGALTFVTFRLADSMPCQVVQQWHNEVEDWLQANGLTGQSVDQVIQSPTVEQKLKSELKRFKNRIWHGHLDDCHGSCLLRDEAVRRFVANSLLHFDGQRYDVERFVIMPNHVHVLIQMRTNYLLRKQFREIQRFTAREINSHLGRTGSLWQSEPFDHVVRSEAQFAYLQRYIDDNPTKARLSVGGYTLWIST